MHTWDVHEHKLHGRFQNIWVRPDLYIQLNRTHSLHLITRGSPQGYSGGLQPRFVDAELIEHIFVQNFDATTYVDQNTLDIYPFHIHDYNQRVRIDISSW